MASISQAPAQCNLTGVSGNPFSVNVAVTLTDGSGNPIPWSEVSDLTVTVTNPNGAEYSQYEPTVMTPSDNNALLSWTTAQTAAIARTGSLLYALSLTIEDTGPLTVVAGQLRFTPETQAGPSNPSATASVLIGQTTVDLDVTVGGAGGGVSSVNDIDPDDTGNVTLTAPDVGTDASGAAATAQSNAEAYTDEQVANYLPLAGGEVTGDILLTGDAEITGAPADATAKMRLGQKDNGEMVWSWNVDQDDGDQIDDPSVGTWKFSIEASPDYNGAQFQYSPPGDSWNSSVVFQLDEEGNLALTGSVTSDDEVLASESYVDSATASAMSVAATTDVGGYALALATATILSWTAPDDGQLHTVNLSGLIVVSSAETGGQVSIDFTLGGSSYSQALMNVGLATGLHTFLNSLNDVCWIVVDPGTTVSIVQSSALTGGAAALYASIIAN